MNVEPHKLVEDGKVVGAGTCTIWLQYSQVLNETLTLFITICTAVYVGRRAFKAVVGIIKDIKKYFKKKRKKK